MKPSAFRGCRPFRGVRRSGIMGGGCTNLSARPRLVSCDPPAGLIRRPRASLEKGRTAMTPGIGTALDASVLVLNKTFLAVHVISVRRAFCLLCKELAEVVSLEDGAFATYDFQSWAELSELRAPMYSALI
eukprot:Opistho-1_new@108676